MYRVFLTVNGTKVGVCSVHSNSETNLCKRRALNALFSVCGLFEKMDTEQVS
jgi:hypothetical protein